MRLIGMIVCLFFVSSIMGQSSNDYEPLTHPFKDFTLPYNILFPSDFDKNKSYPLILFLHGRGESGTDNKSQLTHGANVFRSKLDSFPAIVIFPQCPKSHSWYAGEKLGGGNYNFKDPGEISLPLHATIDLLDSLMQKTFVDKDRIYLSGLSMGGMGVLELLWRKPNTFAAAVPICGGAHRAQAQSMKDVPVWLVHGVEDRVVHPRYSMMMVRAIQQAGGKAKITLYPDVGHNAWDKIFADPRYLPWIFKHKRNGK